ncbi:MAG: TonB-dependent receptor [Bacteroidetes bacterium]|nr:MAG: TonB-dependent receptor [Bacteroidota bacterium]REK04857.1 MAG: TonB-dependent receptor [Bacteroidota bacterium]REK36329.1 MAG: TonB-dependent receptor [Bacteroidota bacterium]
MSAIRKLILPLLFIIPCLSMAQTATLKGVVHDEAGIPVENAKIEIRPSGVFTTSDSSGSFSIFNVPYGKTEVNISGEAFNAQLISIDITQPEVNLDIQTTDRLFESAKAASDNIPVITLSDDDLREGSAGGVSSVLSASRDAFTSATSFVFSAARFRIRGYEDENFLTLMNGIPMNDIVSGRNLYSSFSGLNDVVRSREYSQGLAPATYSYGSIGGVYHIDSRASRQRKQFQTSYAHSNRSYDNRFMITYGSGISNSGWSYALSYSRRWADEGFVKGTFYDGHSYFASVEKIINSKHSLALTAFGASTKNGRSAPAVLEILDLAGTNYYNPYWGYQNGKKRNANVGHGHQPIAILTHDWKVSDRSSLLTAASFQTGSYKVSGLDWYNAEDPRPDYYRRLPSYDPFFGENPEAYAALSAEVAAALRSNEALRQIQWDKLYEANQINDTTFNGTSGKWAKYVVADRVTDNRRINFNSTYSSIINDNLQFNGGLTVQNEVSEYYKEVKDLMGADFFTDLNQFADLSNSANKDVLQNNLDNPNRILKEGDRYSYNYAAHVNHAAVWGQGVWKYNRMDYFAGVQLSNTSFYRSGKYRNGVFPNNSLGDSDTESFFNYSLKGGATYKHNGRNYFFANAAYLTRAPLFENAFVSPRTRDFIANDLKSESIYSVEGGYLLRAPRVKAKAVAYYTRFNDGTETKSFYHGDFRTFVNYTITQIDKRHAGFELAAEVNAGKGITLSAVAAIGEHIYSDRPLATITQDNKDTLLASNEIVFAKNLHVAGGPQSAYTFGINYRSKKFWFVNVNFNYFNNLYIDFNPSRRTYNALDLVEAGTAKWNEILSQERTDGQFTMDASAGWSWRLNNKFRDLKKQTFIVFNLGVSNLLNNEDMITSGFEQLRFDADTKDVNRFAPKYYYGYGTTFFASITFRMN